MQQPKQLKPDHLHIIRLYWNGYQVPEIASFLSYSEQTVRNILACDEAKEILARMRDSTLDSYDDTQAEFQLVVPLIRREKIRLALQAQDERVRNIACSDILAIAGHGPVKRVQVEHLPTAAGKALSDMTPTEMREAIYKDLMEGDKANVPGTGPADGDDEPEPGSGGLLN